MKRLLLVDNDAAGLRAYRERLSAHGFQVNTANDGSAAINILRSAKPDLVVLELTLPTLSGVDVLRFIRSQPRLAPTPVVVLTKAFLNDLGRQAAAIGIEKALIKAQCSPSELMSVIDELLHPKEPPVDEPLLPETIPPELAVNLAEAEPEPVPMQEAPKAASLKTPQAQKPAMPVPLPPPAPSQSPPPFKEPDAAAAVDVGLLVHGPKICADLRSLFKDVALALKDEAEKKRRLQDFYLKVHLLTSTAAPTAYNQITRVATVFERLLSALVENPAHMNASVLRTLAALVDSVEQLILRAGSPPQGGLPQVRVLVVDDDPVSNRLVVSALAAARLEAQSTEDSNAAWSMLQKEHYDVFLLDIEMPGLGGLEICKRLRALPHYKKTPVIFVTAHGDLASRTKSTLSGGDDLVTKPILPAELAAKVVMQVVKRQAAG